MAAQNPGIGPSATASLAPGLNGNESTVHIKAANGNEGCNPNGNEPKWYQHRQKRAAVILPVISVIALPASQPSACINLCPGETSGSALGRWSPVDAALQNSSPDCWVTNAGSGISCRQWNLSDDECRVDDCTSRVSQLSPRSFPGSSIPLNCSVPGYPSTTVARSWTR